MVADHLLVFEGDGKLKDFPAGYSRYLEWKELKESEEQGQTAQAGPGTAKGKVSDKDRVMETPAVPMPP